MKKNKKQEQQEIIEKQEEEEKEVEEKPEHEKQRNRYNLISDYCRIFKTTPTALNSLIDRVIFLFKNGDI